jgi:hypothetical protein
MLEGKKNNISIYIAPTNLVGDVAVSLSFKAKLNVCTLNKLNGCCCCNLMQKNDNKTECLSAWPVGSEESCICFSQYLLIKNALCGDPLATKKSKVGAVLCGSNDGCFFVTWKVKGTGSAVRKSLGIALRNLNPGKLFADYTRCVNELNYKPDRSAFNSAADDIIDNIKNSVQCGVVGNIKTNQDFVNDMIEILANRLNVKPASSPKKKASVHTNCDHSDYTEIKVDGWEADVAKDYINAKVRGISVVLCNKSLIINIEGKKWQTIANKIKSYVDDYVAAKHGKVGSDLPSIMGYQMIANASISASDVREVIKKGVSAADVKSAIKKAL